MQHPRKGRWKADRTTEYSEHTEIRPQRICTRCFGYDRTAFHSPIRTAQDFGPNLFLALTDSLRRDGYLEVACGYRG
jgi:hypothetical protein